MQKLCPCPAATLREGLGEQRGPKDLSMTSKQVIDLLNKIRDGKLTPDQGLEKLKNLPFEDLGYARVDHHRTLRQGFPEVIFSPGKTPDQVAGIVKSLLKQKYSFLAHLLGSCYRSYGVARNII